MIIKIKAPAAKPLREADVEFMKRKKTAALLSNKKLILVLDLDHTLLHSRSVRKIRKEQPHLLNHPESASPSLLRSDSVRRLTKLRPFVRTFLKEASEMFTMFVYTLGGRGYADGMVEILDPGREYFFDHDGGGTRVFAREDCTAPRRKGLDVVPGEERAVVVVDDTEGVWEGHRGNLVRVDPYDFFGKSSGVEEEEDDDALAKTLALLRKVHARFFDPTDGTEMSSRDTREVLKRIRHEEEEEAMCIDKKKRRINLRLKFQQRSIWMCINK